MGAFDAAVEVGPLLRRTNDSPGFQAAMDAMGPVTSGEARHGTLFVPPGDYWLADNLKIERAIRLTGVAPGSPGAMARLIFAPYEGIRVYEGGDSPRGGNASYAVIEGHLEKWALPSTAQIRFKVLML